MNVVLMGYRGSGKTSVGKKVSRILGVPFCDTDEVVQRLAGRTIRRIVEDGGWPQFRRAETEAIAGAVRQDGVVIGLGGGAVMEHANIELLKERGWFVWLQADEAALKRRLEGDGSTVEQRPPLQIQGRDEKQLLALRIPVYRNLADFIVDTTEMTVEEVAEKIAATFLRQKKTVI